LFKKGGERTSKNIESFNNILKYVTMKLFVKIMKGGKDYEE